MTDDSVADLEQKSQMQASSIKFAEILDKSELEMDDSRDVVSLGHARNHRASRLDDFLENPMSQRVNLLDSQSDLSLVFSDIDDKGYEIRQDNKSEHVARHSDKGAIDLKN